MNKNRWFLVIVFFFSFFLYLYTLAPGWGAINIFNTWDGLEYVLCSSFWGIDHPPGHPFYLLLGKLFSSLLAIKSLAFRLNLFSAFFGAATIVLMYLTVSLTFRLIGKPREPLLHQGIALVIAATLAVSKVFWTHALITEVHTLFLFLLLLSIYLIMRYFETKNRRWLWGGSFVSGLLISTSILNALTVLLPILLFLLIFHFATQQMDLRTKDLIKAGLCLFAGTAFYLYYPIVIGLGPRFVHPMNLTSPDEVGTFSWYLWYLSGQAWTGGGMFSIERTFSNLPNFLRHTLDNFTFVIACFFGYGLILGLKNIYRLFHSGSEPNENQPGLRQKLVQAPVELKLFGLFLLLYGFIAVPQLSLQDISNPGTTTYIYVANFFLPSFVPYLLLSAMGLGALVDYLDQRGFFTKVVQLFRAEPNPDTAPNRAISFILVYGLAIIPMVLLSKNYPVCNLRGQDSAALISKALIDRLPPQSVIYSKLVYHQIYKYYHLTEPQVRKKGVTIISPDLLFKGIKPLPGFITAMEKGARFKQQIARDLQKGVPVYLAGDCVDLDKSPEVLTISDLHLYPEMPQEALTRLTRPLPPELVLYRVAGFRQSKVISGKISVENKGLANDGTFANMLALLGYTTVRDPAPPFGRKKISLDIFWRVLDKIPEDLLGLVVLLNEKLQRIDPMRTSGYFSLGGTYPSSRWQKGELLKERIHYYLPELPFGRYFLGLGLRSQTGQSILYYPANYQQTRKPFDFVLFVPFVFGPTAGPRPPQPSPTR